MSTLNKWLQRLEVQKPVDTIKLGLDRVKSIANELGLTDFTSIIITVAGTNGKGSTVAVLEQLLLDHGKTVASYTSPHLFKFNERIRINGQNILDEKLVKTFEELEKYEQSNELTYFEWMTISAMMVFNALQLDYILLEVGLGGRLDAVNAFDADIALITSIDFDHMDYLGNTLNDIAFEKAGVFRHKQRVFCSEPNPPQSMLSHAAELKVDIKQIDKDYYADVCETVWSFKTKYKELCHLPKLDLHINNISNALACFLSLNIPYSDDSIKKSLLNISLIGRGQLIPNNNPIIFDVAHNRQSILSLCSKLKKMQKKCLLVFSMLKDKQINEVIELLVPYCQHWYVAPVNSQRSYTKDELNSIFKLHTNVALYDSIEEAFSNSQKQQNQQQPIVCCGSFLTVAEAMTTQVP